MVKERPAQYAAYCILRLACMLSPWMYASYRLARMALTASTESLRVFLIVDPPMYASTACVKASIPVVDVILGGSPFVMTGSRSAYFGPRQKSIMVNLSLVFSSTMTAAMVVSDPVPDVVGQAMKRGSFPNTFKMPFMLLKVRLGFKILAPAALAQSMADPPPMAMRQSHPVSRYSFAASSAFCMVGFTTVSLYTSYSRPLASRASLTGSTSPHATMPLSVTMRGFFLFSLMSASAASAQLRSLLGFLYGKKGIATWKTNWNALHHSLLKTFICAFCGTHPSAGYTAGSMARMKRAR